MPSLVDALRTDLYQLTMAAGYFHGGLSAPVATFEMFVRRLPHERRYLLAMGLERVLEYLERLRFTEEELAYLATVPALREAMTPAFMSFLRQLRFTGDVDAVPEGTAVFAQEPLVRIRAPLIEAQLIETFLLSALNHATLIASKAARIVHAAGDAQVVEFGTRRTHPAAAIDAARAAYGAGMVGTSNVEAGLRYGIPVMGTMAHSWVMAHPSEEAAFDDYIKTFPSTAVLLIDTYDTLRGARRAALAAQGRLQGVRLDSGDLAVLAREVRRILDDHGCRDARIVASGDLDEYSIAALRAAGAPIDIYGVGTKLVASTDAPALGGVYKLVALEHDGVVSPVAKYSEGKVMLPGAHQVYRYRGPDGRLAGDVLALVEERPEDLAPGPGAIAVEPLLGEVMRGGKRIRPPEALKLIQDRVRRELAALPPELLLLEEPAPTWPGFAATPSQRLRALGEEVRARVAPGTHGG